MKIWKKFLNLFVLAGAMFASFGIGEANTATAKAEDQKEYLSMVSKASSQDRVYLTQVAMNTSENPMMHYSHQSHS